MLPQNSPSQIQNRRVISGRGGERRFETRQVFQIRR
jgi:hypothetical protein